MLYTQAQQTLCTQIRFLPETGKITYMLLEDVLPNGEAYYSITVQCDGSTLQDYRTVRDLTMDKDLALQLFWKVCRGTVTPYSLLEVLSELLP